MDIVYIIYLIRIYTKPKETHPSELPCNGVVLLINRCPDNRRDDQVDEPQCRIRPPESGRHQAHFLVAVGRDQTDDEEDQTGIYGRPWAGAEPRPDRSVGPDQQEADYEVKEDVDGDLPAPHRCHLVTQASLERVGIGLHPG